MPPGIGINGQGRDGRAHGTHTDLVVHVLAR
jgi:hypothetical protein